MNVLDGGFANISRLMGGSNTLLELQGPASAEKLKKNAFNGKF